MIRVAVVGAGYWGPNLIRNFSSCPETELVAVCDPDLQRLAAVIANYPGVSSEPQLDPLLVRDDIDAVAVATPVVTHFPIALAALEAGKHVLVEKPLATSVSEAKQLIAAADQSNRTLMVDHTYVYSGAIQKIKAIVDAGEIGEVYFIDSVRINLGLFQRDVNVVWDLAPHDLSILDYLLGRLPLSVSAFGASHADQSNEIEDVAYLSLDYGDGLLASLHVNWLSPVKIRHFIIGGSNKSIVFNDLEVTEKIKIYDRGFTVNEDPQQRRGILVDYRTGDIWSPHVERVEPLQVMVSHFADCILHEKRPRTDGEVGLRVVRILEAAQRSIKGQEGRVML